MNSWLKLHALDAALCRKAVADGQAQHGTTPPAIDRNAAINLTTDDILATVAAGFGQMIPGAASEIADQLQRVPLVCDPEVVKRLSGGQRALTLEDDGTGRPVVLCPYAGRLRDAIALAHELGHALQYLRAPKTVSPVVREVAAFLAELALIRGLEATREATAAQLQAYWTSQTWHIFHDQGRALLKALEQHQGDPQTRADVAYDYAWNYPIGRRALLQLVPPDAPADSSGASTQQAMVSILNGTLDLGAALRG